MTNELQTMKADALAAMDSIAQARSTYQLQHFVVGQHDTLERQYQQCLLELNVKLNNIKRDEIALKKLKTKLANEQDEDERTLIEIDIEELSFSLKGQMREAGVLYTIFKAMPKYSYQELQEAEEKYWTLRLARQAELDVAERRLGISSGNMEALRQAGMVEGFSQTFIEQTLPAITQQKELS